MHGIRMIDTVEKGDFITTYLYNGDIIILFRDTADLSAVDSTSFDNELQIEDTMKNRLAVYQKFGMLPQSL